MPEITAKTTMQTISEDVFAKIRHGDKVTILVPAGGSDWAERTGKAVMRSAHGGWVLNMGGPHGTPGIADLSNTVAVKFGKGPRKHAKP